MPLYVYSCPKCGEFEKEHSIKDKLEKCPTCKEKGENNDVKRLIQSTSFILNGGGWGSTNYS